MPAVAPVMIRIIAIFLLSVAITAWAPKAIYRTCWCIVLASLILSFGGYTQRSSSDTLIWSFQTTIWRLCQRKTASNISFTEQLPKLIGNASTLSIEMKNQTSGTTT